MLNVEAVKNNEGISVEAEFTGDGETLLDESYGAIRAIVANIKDCDYTLWGMFLSWLSDDPDWMCADEEVKEKEGDDILVM